MKPARPLPSDLGPEEVDLLERVRAAPLDCPEPELLQAALAGALPEPTAGAIHRHLATCPACAALAADPEGWSGAPLSAMEEKRIRRRLDAEVEAPPRAPRRWLWAAVAALFAAAVPAVLLLHGPAQPRPTPSGVVATPAGAPVLALEKLDVLTPPGAALVWRDGGPPEARALRAALDLYEKGDLAGAAVRLQAVGDRFPQVPAAPLYGGIALLLLDRPAEAAAALESARARATPFWRPHAEWYLAVAREREGDRGRALTSLRALCGGGSAYDQRACAGARALSAPHP